MLSSVGNALGYGNGATAHQWGQWGGQRGASSLGLSQVESLGMFWSRLAETSASADCLPTLSCPHCVGRQLALTGLPALGAAFSTPGGGVPLAGLTWPHPGAQQRQEDGSQLWHAGGEQAHSSAHSGKRAVLRHHSALSIHAHPPSPPPEPVPGVPGEEQWGGRGQALQLTQS